MGIFEKAKDLAGVDVGTVIKVAWTILPKVWKAISRQIKWSRLPRCTFNKKERCGRKGGKATKCSVRYDENGLLRAWEHSEYVSCDLNITKEKFKGGA